MNSFVYNEDLGLKWNLHFTYLWCSKPDLVIGKTGKVLKTESFDLWAGGKTRHFYKRIIKSSHVGITLQEMSEPIPHTLSWGKIGAPGSPWEKKNCWYILLCAKWWCAIISTKIQLIRFGLCNSLLQGLFILMLLKWQKENSLAHSYGYYWYDWTLW